MENVGLVAALAGAMTKAPTAEQVTTAVDAWLDDHPEATTTVTDGAVTTDKLASGAVTRVKLADAALADIAAEYSSSATYNVGDYCFKSGFLYRCKTEISTAEAWTSSHWEKKVLAGDFKDLKDALADIADTTEVFSSVDTSSIQRASTKKITTQHNIETSASNHSVLYMQVSEDGVYKVASSDYSQYAAYVYKNISDASSITSANYVKAFSNGRAELAAGQWICTTAWSPSYTITVDHLEGYETVLKSTTPFSEKQEEDLKTAIDATVNDVTDDGYIYIKDGWERGGYNAWNSKDSRSYRVRLSTPLSFDRGVYLIAKPGFYIDGYKSGNVNIDTQTVYYLPANTQLCLFVRRISENSSETADVDAFASQVIVSTALAPIELYSPTFTDVSMFERVGVCGDSYAGGGGIISGITSLTWGKNLQRQAGVTVDIYAQSGQTIVEWNANSTKGLPAVLAGNECGLYWMAHGINNTAIIGTEADMDATPKPNTFYGQYAYAIEQIQATFPKARIVLATVTGTSYALYQTTYAAVNTAIKNIAEHYSLPCIDIVDDDFYKSTFYENNCRSNHPTAMLCAGMAMANRRLLAKCIMDNPSYFVNYGT